MSITSYFNDKNFWTKLDKIDFWFCPTAALRETKDCELLDKIGDDAKTFYRIYRYISYHIALYE